MSTFVIVHGAWAGAWGWDRVAKRLRARGHDVHVPTLSGLGERSHLNTLPITLTTHIDDIVNEVLFHDLTDIVLVAHSYGGIVGTGAIERIGDRVASVVYVDAFIPKDGQGFVDFVQGWELKGELIDSPPSSPGDYLRETDRAWVDAKATPQPIATLTEKLPRAQAYTSVPKKTYIVATGWNGLASFADTLRADPAWHVHEVHCGHDVAIDMPDELTELLMASAACSSPDSR